MFLVEFCIPGFGTSSFASLPVLLPSELSSRATLAGCESSSGPWFWERGICSLMGSPQPSAKSCHVGFSDFIRASRMRLILQCQITFPAPILCFCSQLQIPHFVRDDNSQE